VGGWVVGLFLFGFIVPGINNWAHGGGIIGGVLFGILLGYGDRRRESPLHRYLAMACGVVTVGVLAWAAIVAAAIRFVH
jgi:rhomboid protease GluP